jgi:hypothetical protein
MWENLPDRVKPCRPGLQGGDPDCSFSVYAKGTVFSGHGQSFLRQPRFLFSKFRTSQRRTRRLWPPQRGLVVLEIKLWRVVALIIALQGRYSPSPG